MYHQQNSEKICFFKSFPKIRSCVIYICIHIFTFRINPVILKNCSLCNPGWSLLPFPRSFSEPLVSTEEVGRLIIWLDLQTSTLQRSIFLNDTKATTWLTDCSFDQGRGATWGAAAARMAERGPTRPVVHAALGRQVLLDVRKVYITPRGFYGKVGTWPNSTYCFAHKSADKEQEGPLAWSDQLHNADTFSLTSVGRKGGGGRSCAPAGVSKKNNKKNTSLKNKWHHRYKKVHVWRTWTYSSVPNHLWHKHTLTLSLTQLPTPVRWFHVGTLMLSRSAGNRLY